MREKGVNLHRRLDRKTLRLFWPLFCRLDTDEDLSVSALFSLPHTCIPFSFIPIHPTCTHEIKDPEDYEKVTDKTRRLGLVVIRGTQVSIVSPQDGVEEIANPFLVAGDEE